MKMVEFIVSTVPLGYAVNKMYTTYIVIPRQRLHMNEKKNTDYRDIFN